MSIGPTPRPQAQGPRSGLSQLLTRDAWRMAVRRPHWFVANMLQGPAWLWDARYQVEPKRFSEFFVTEDEALSAVLDADPAEGRRVRESLWRPVDDPNERLAVWNARRELIDLVGTIVRIARPRVMVETGVALGYTTATILAAMRENGGGTLHSVDLPALQYDPDAEVGRAVPPDLRDRWHLVLGLSQWVLPRLMRDVGPVDVFLHDANHAYHAQRREYRTAWPHLRSGGLLISDDVGNPAFVEFARRVGVRPYLIPGAKPESVIGVLRKP